jgi:hypothetical protein
MRTCRGFHALRKASAENVAPDALRPCGKLNDPRCGMKWLGWSVDQGMNVTALGT